MRLPTCLVKTFPMLPPGPSLPLAFAVGVLRGCEGTTRLGRAQSKLQLVGVVSAALAEITELGADGESADLFFLCVCVRSCQRRTPGVCADTAVPDGR